MIGRQVRHEVALDDDLLGLEQRNGAFDGAFDDLGRRQGHLRPAGQSRFDARVLQHALHHFTEAARFGLEQLPVTLHPIAAVDDAV